MCHLLRKVDCLYACFWCINGAKCITSHVPDSLQDLCYLQQCRTKVCLNTASFSNSWKKLFFTRRFWKSVWMELQGQTEYFWVDQIFLTSDFCIYVLCITELFLKDFMIGMQRLGKFLIENKYFIEPERKRARNKSKLLCNRKACISGFTSAQSEHCTMTVFWMDIYIF